MKRSAVVYLGALLSVSAAPHAFGWGSVHGAYGGAAYRGPMGTGMLKYLLASAM